MDNNVAKNSRGSSRALHVFSAPKKSLGNLGPESAAKLITAAADVALVISSEGVVEDLSFGTDDLSAEEFGEWVGQPWIDTVTVESRPKISELLESASAKAATRWRQVNHPRSAGADLPITYSAMQVGQKGRVLAVGRDLRATAELQQQLVTTQLSLERDYSRLRQAETRYRLLFQISSEPVLIVDARTQRIAEANPAASDMLGKTSKRLIGSAIETLFIAEDRDALRNHLVSVRAAGPVDDARLTLAEGDAECVVSASLFRQEQTSQFLVRISPVSQESDQRASHLESSVLKVVEKLPDGFVVTDENCNILTANSAFLDLTETAELSQVRGEPLDNWLGRSEVNLNVLTANLEERDLVRNFTTIIRGRYGSIEDIEVSAVKVSSDEQECIGFAIRTLERKATDAELIGQSLPRPVEELTQLVGRVPLKELVREATDMIERLSIEAALELTEDNRALAADMLGLSRQSLYMKLRRHGLGDLDS